MRNRGGNQFPVACFCWSCRSSSASFSPLCPSSARLGICFFCFPSRCHPRTLPLSAACRLFPFPPVCSFPVAALVRALTPFLLLLVCLFSRGGVCAGCDGRNVAWWLVVGGGGVSVVCKYFLRFSCWSPGGRESIKQPCTYF